jgi:flagellar motor switch protein FliG
MSAPAIRQGTAPRKFSRAADLTPAERVAVVLSLLEPEKARAVVEHWPQPAVDRVVVAYEGMGTLPKPVVLEVIAAFVSEVADPRPSVRGGQRHAAALAAAMGLGEAPAEEDERAPIEEGAPPEAVWRYATSLPVDALRVMLAGERVAVVAAVLSRVGDQKAAELLAALSEGEAAAVTLHLAGGAGATGPAADAIAEALRRRVAGGKATPAAQSGPAKGLAAILNRVPLSRQEVVLGPLRASQPEVAAEVERRLLRYGTLPERLPRTAVPQLFREADQAALDAALRHGEEAALQTNAFLYESISQRLAEQIKERVAERPKPSREEGEAAQAAVLSLLLGWAEEGRFALVEPAEGD